MLCKMAARDCLKVLISGETRELSRPRIADQKLFLALIGSEPARLSI